MAACCPGFCSSCPGDLQCVWTTCKDSVAQALAVYEYVAANYCVDLDAVWATGGSNGGVFSHELAYDPRSRDKFAGIVPVVGLPHNGYNRAAAARHSTRAARRPAALRGALRGWSTGWDV